MPTGTSRSREGGATRDSVAPITISQFVYRAVSLLDTTIGEGTAFKAAYRLQQAMNGIGPEWPEAQDYQAWAHSLDAWKRIVMVARAVERQETGNAE